jgi:hypothetical protein
MLHDIEHAGGDDTANLTPGLLDTLDLQPDLIERGDQRVRRGVDGRELPDPGQGSFHTASLRGHLGQAAGSPGRRTETMVGWSGELASATKVIAQY